MKRLGDDYSGAEFGDEGVESPYRYLLWRRTDEGLLPFGADTSVLFIMLNPSTANHEKPDATITRCVDFASRWGHRKLEVVNLFAFRSTLPSALKKVDDPVGPENDRVILEAAQRASVVVCAWGNHGALHDRSRKVLLMLQEHGIRPKAMSLTASMHPQHPLYMLGTSMPILDVPVPEERKKRSKRSPGAPPPPAAPEEVRRSGSEWDVDPSVDDDDEQPKEVERPRAPTADKNIVRVRSTIGTSIVAFCKAKLGKTFHMEDLRRHIVESTGAAAPASADRILRDLRSDKVVLYSVVDRSKSLYRVDAVDAEA